jgi:hypothetical protein
MVEMPADDKPRVISVIPGFDMMTEEEREKLLRQMAEWKRERDKKSAEKKAPSEK